MLVPTTATEPASSAFVPMPPGTPLLEGLNEAQRAAVTADSRPLLVVAGAGTGKTRTLVHRVAWSVAGGIDPTRILLLTFSRRAASEMLRRAGALLSAPGSAGAAHAGSTPSVPVRGGTFHSVAHQILRVRGDRIGLGTSFTVLDRGDAEDLLDLCRSGLGLDRGRSRFPRKGTCLSILSRAVNTGEPLEAVLASAWPWCAPFRDDLRELFHRYTQRKQEEAVLDYDDLLLYWSLLMREPSLAAEVRSAFSRVLVDEYQDTNRLQREILLGLCPTGEGLTVVGDDAQSIYAFRGATVRNILEFPEDFPGARVLRLEENHRSTAPILALSNAVIAEAKDRWEKSLFTRQEGGALPRLVTVTDEPAQSDYLIDRILEHREEGIPLRRQCVLFRTAHHADALEVELTRRNIPYVKFGGLRFLEAAHVKDLLALLRVAENPRDSVAGFRALQLLEGIGPRAAGRALEFLAASGWKLPAWSECPVPAATRPRWSGFVDLLGRLAGTGMGLPDQIAAVREFLRPLLERRYEDAAIRIRDLDQLEQISRGFPDRATLLAELTLDPPASTQDLAGPPLLDEDWLVLSTIHSAKGLEFDCVYLIHAADGNIPSDMATGAEEEIEEERRILYVALTRARDVLEVCVPLRYPVKGKGPIDRHGWAQVSRFLPDRLLSLFERVSPAPPGEGGGEEGSGPGPGPAERLDLRARAASLWGPAGNGQ